MNVPVSILFFGILIVLTILLRSVSGRHSLPPLIGFILLGFLIRFADTRLRFLSLGSQDVLELLAEIGVIALLFRVGLESNIRGLIKQMRPAGIIWTGNIVLSGALAVAAARYVIGLTLVQSLFIGVALTATSVGVSVSIWREAGAISSPTGELMVDVAGMDDVSGIMLMVLLLAAAPSLQKGFDLSVVESAALTLGILLLKLLVFGILCLVFSVYIEPHVTEYFRSMKGPAEPTLLITGIGIIIAALAGLMGFSLALGAFFAGLVFSRDPEAVKLDSSFEVIYDLFTPFFFIGIGLRVTPESLLPALGPGGILLAVAVIGKILGNGIPSLLVTGWVDSILLSMSMIPRAEIAMIIMQRGHELGDWAVPDLVFGAMVIVSLASCLLSPLLLKRLLKKWPQGN
jgi:Kef-type K+ transport system membrane component KefB